jgi:hypothetical protein
MTVIRPTALPDWACLALPQRISTVTMYRLAQAFAVLGILLWLASGLWERLNLKDRPSAVRPGKPSVQCARQDDSPMVANDPGLRPTLPVV